MRVMNRVVNLRRFRKLKQRKAAEAEAADQRLAYGQSKARKKLMQAERKAAQKALDGHKRTPPNEPGHEDS
jgi:hypothetical protein